MKHLTNGELDAAIAASCAKLDPVCTSVQTLKRLRDGRYGHEHEIVTLDAGAPVTIVEFDAALSGLEAPASALKVLKRFRSLLAQVEERAAKAPAVPVSRGELDAFLGAFAVVVAQINAASNVPAGYSDAKVANRLKRIAQDPDAYGLTEPQAAVFERLVGAVDRAADRDNELERRAMAARGNGGGPFHF